MGDSSSIPIPTSVKLACKLTRIARIAPKSLNPQYYFQLLEVIHTIEVNERLQVLASLFWGGGWVRSEEGRAPFPASAPAKDGSCSYAWSFLSQSTWWCSPALRQTATSPGCSNKYRGNQRMRHARMERAGIDLNSLLGVVPLFIALFYYKQNHFLKVLNHVGIK